MLGLLPKALEQYQDPIAVAKASELALITYTALLDAVEKSDAHAVISELPQEKKTGYFACVGRSDMHKGRTFEEPHTYVMKRQSNATSKSQASKK
jgi:hypothetical protein